MASYSTFDFDFDLEQASPSLGIWVSSGRTTVAPLPDTVCGVGAFFAPPLAAPDCSLALTFDLGGETLVDRAHLEGVEHLLCQGGRWHPGRVTRWGTYHRFRSGRLVSFGVTSELVPTRRVPGYVLAVRVTNRGSETLSIRLTPHLVPGGPRRRPIGEWEYDPPDPGARAVPLGPGAWGNDEAVVSLRAEHDALELEPGVEQACHVSVELSTPAKGATALRREAAEQAMGATEQWWGETVRARLDSLPTIASSHEGLERYYRRSLMSGLACIWDSPDFVFTPWIATGGLDGGTMCAYVWDLCGYAPNVVTMLLGESTGPLLELLGGIDFNRHYAVGLDGGGLGVAYAYSAWSFVSLVRALAAHRGIDAASVELAAEIVEAGERGFSAAGDLLDFGSHLNLLEMRTAGWEHVVASPNAERAWSLAVLADLAELTSASVDVGELRRRAKRIGEAVRNGLWDEQRGWFCCRYPDGHVEVVFSVQVFDALRAGICSAEMVEAVVSHVRDGAYLGEYGVSSVSREDRVHYEVGDPDWSGSGAYEGEATTLALTLWELGRPGLAWNVLRRLLWMGGQLPYFPQEHYCHRPDLPRHKRMNVVAGLGGAEAILFGLVGLEPRIDGSLWLRPRQPVPATIELRGFGFRGRIVDIDLAPTGWRVAVDGRRVHEGEPRPIRL